MFCDSRNFHNLWQPLETFNIFTGLGYIGYIDKHLLTTQCTSSQQLKQGRHQTLGNLWHSADYEPPTHTSQLGAGPSSDYGGCSGSCHVLSLPPPLLNTGPLDTFQPWQVAALLNRNPWLAPIHSATHHYELLKMQCPSPYSYLEINAFHRSMV